MEDARQLILADRNFRDIGAVWNAQIDISVGVENEYEVKVRRGEWKNEYTFGNIFYIKDTEYGGIIGEINTNTGLDTISIIGRTWRGNLEKKIIKPPSGADYLTVSGELNTVIGNLVKGQFDDYFVVSQEDTGISVEDYKFERYCTLLSGINKMLKSEGYRLRIQYVQQEQGEPGYVELSAVPIADYSDRIELSQDSRVNFIFKNNKNGINHLVCLGKGELQERQVIDLYVQGDGSIGTIPFFKGMQEIAEVYDNTSAEADELKEKGIEKMQEIMNSTSFSMDVETLGIDVEIGDIIGGRDYLTGNYAKKPIAEKVYRVKNGETTLEYKIEGDDK